jgi:hypothetical protein
MSTDLIGLAVIIAIFIAVAVLVPARHHRWAVPLAWTWPIWFWLGWWILH